MHKREPSDCELPADIVPMSVTSNDWEPFAYAGEKLFISPGLPAKLGKVVALVSAQGEYVIGKLETEADGFWSIGTFNRHGASRLVYRSEGWSYAGRAFSRWFP